jgi:hypothetical protein
MTLELSVLSFLWLLAHQPSMGSFSGSRGAQSVAGPTLHKSLLWSENIYLEGVIEVQSHVSIS